MPWKVSRVVEKRKQFVEKWLSENWTMTELCAHHGISRRAGYNTLARYQRDSWKGLEAGHRAPRRHPNLTPPAMEQPIVELRHEHMRWGPRKLKVVLQRKYHDVTWPAASTMGELLHREGLLIPRKKRRRTDPYTTPFAAASAPNRVWCGDFKGWSRTQDGERIDPLTITDACTRYLLRCQAVEKTDTVRVQAIFEAAFREHGLPQAIRTPAHCYASSPRPYPARVPEPEYDCSMTVRRVAPGGQFSWKHHEIFVSETLQGERIGWQPIDDRWYTIYFAQFPLGRFDSRTRTVHRLPPAAGFYKTDAGEGEPPLPLHPIPKTGPKSVNHVPGLNCQRCARLDILTPLLG